MTNTATHARAAVTAPTVGAVVAQDLRPHVREIDERGVYPERALRRLGTAGAYSRHLADGTGGLAAAIADMATVGETCGSTAFCMWCQDALAWYLDRSPNRDLTGRLLADVSSGRRLGGTGLSNPMKSFSGIEPLALKGERVTGGWRVNGRLPWVSNLGEDHLFASVFTAADGHRVMAVFDCGAEGVKLAQNAHFIALEGTRTFTVLLRDVFIEDADVIAEDAATFVPTIRQGFVLLQLGMALGAARGVADAMDADVSARANAKWLPLQPDAIRARAADLFARTCDLAQSVDDPGRAAFLAVLRLRLDASWLALEATQALALQAGARGYLKSSDSDRRRREAQFVAIVTPSIKHITRELSVG
jgi:alkylation response protein AidB-like acyl-CoA dehydrogenase